jgi:CHAT domain-containing protein/tetratricopeptide (TPR) repeat protein
MSSEMSERLLVIWRELQSLYSDWDPVRGAALTARHTELGQPQGTETYSQISRALTFLGQLDSRLGDDVGAERRFRAAVEAARRDAGSGFMAEYLALTGLASAQNDLGDHPHAADTASKLVEVARRHPKERGGQLLNRALIYAAGYNSGASRYALAEELGQEAVFRLRKVSESRDLHAALVGLSTTYATMGSWGLSNAFAREAADLSRVNGDLAKHLDGLVDLSGRCVLASANSQSAALRAAKQEEAVALLEEASGVLEKLGSPTESLRVLADGYAYAGDHENAEALFEKALQQASDPLVEARVATSLAESFEKRGADQLAEPLRDRVLRIRRGTSGVGRPELAKALVSCAALHRRQGRLGTAERFAREALALSQGPGEEPARGTRPALRELAKVCAGVGRTEEALSFVRTLVSVDERLASEVFTIGSDAQRLEFVRLLRGSTGLMLSIALAEPGAVAEALTLVFRRKALAAEAVASRRDAVLAGRYPELAEQLQEHRALRLQLAKQSVKSSWTNAPTSAADLHQRVEELERTLARSIPEIDVMSRLRDVNVEAVAAELPAGTALVEFVHFLRQNFAGQAGKPVKTYAAFVLKAHEPTSAALVGLGAADRIEDMVGGYRHAVSRKARSRSVMVAQAAARPRRVDTRLREVLFDPLLPMLHGVHQLFLAPDGELSRLPFQTLPVGDGRRLIDDYSISYLTAGRDLLRFSASTHGRAAAPVIVADPDFDLPPGGKASPRALGKGNSSRKSSLAGRPTFRRLPGAQREGRLVAEMLGARALVRHQAVKARVESVRSPQILHLATHGFALPMRPLSDDDEQSPQAAQSRAGLASAVAALENPLLRCGLALAGANTWIRTGSAHPDAGDGILNGEDAAALNLAATELVVLSACETGLGDVHAGEGVLGLPRAFLLAGAKTVVMSLWKVPDEQTQLLMTGMYQRLLTGVPRMQALHDAQLAVKARFPDPAYWGGFILVGAPGPLPGASFLDRAEPVLHRSGG